MIPLQQGVDAIAINTAGWAMLIGGLLVTAAWLAKLYR